MKEGKGLRALESKEIENSSFKTRKGGEKMEDCGKIIIIFLSNH